MAPPRLTKSTIAVIDVLMRATDDDPVWGLRICERADLGSGTVYPILDRLAELGWIESQWEAEQPSGRPRRRYYRLTGAGRLEYAAARAARDARRGWRAIVPSSARGRTT
jgi:DNA-binding PadR family transcriptional regulator